MTTEEYPGFATDMQAQYMALATQADGASVITETIFENRYLHASEMVRMGANISIDGRRAVVRGPAKLSGTTVQASDLRASAGLVLAGLVASGETIIDRVYHIDRGYERIVEKLSAVGAQYRARPGKRVSGCFCRIAPVRIWTGPFSDPPQLSTIIVPAGQEPPAGYGRTSNRR